MNERIRELADEAAKFSAIMSLPTGESGDKLFVEKFAELIVKECINCADIVGRVNLASGYPNSTAHHVKQKIQEHFGVEE